MSGLVMRSSAAKGGRPSGLRPRRAEQTCELRSVTPASKSELEASNQTTTYKTMHYIFSSKQILAKYFFIKRYIASFNFVFKAKKLNLCL